MRSGVGKARKQLGDVPRRLVAVCVELLQFASGSPESAALLDESADIRRIRGTRTAHTHRTETRQLNLIKSSFSQSETEAEQSLITHRHLEDPSDIICVHRHGAFTATRLWPQLSHREKPCYHIIGCGPPPRRRLASPVRPQHVPIGHKAALRP